MLFPTFATTLACATLALGHLDSGLSHHAHRAPEYKRFNSSKHVARGGWGDFWNSWNPPALPRLPWLKNYHGHVPLPTYQQIQAMNNTNGNQMFNLANIQGDILIGMKKANENFVFFTINNPSTFKSAMRTHVAALITSTQTLLGTASTPLAMLNVAFSASGLATLGVIPSTLGDPTFTAGMFKDAANLGDGSTASWAEAFQGTTVHGVFLIASDQPADIDAMTAKLAGFFGSAITTTHTINGAARPGANAGHEHFGYLDGISQPAVQGFATSVFPGQASIPGGVILAGHDGDDVARPPWAKDGSFLAFRQLEQFVPEFNKFLADHPITGHGLSAAQGSELLGARMFGRWKSGAPVDLAPLADDPALGADPTRNNNFDFSHSGSNLASDESRCPFSAHIRRTRPRADLGNANIINQAIRAGIPYGPEVSSGEAASSTTSQERGLAFVMYQSNINNGFRFQQTVWANSPSFPPGKTVSTTGFDAVIGMNHGQARTVVGLDINNPQGSITLSPTQWITSRGGEYFFSPSLSAITGTICAGN